MGIIETALNEGRKTLSEYESKQILAEYGIPVTREILISDREQLIPAAREIGYPVVLKGCAPEISHKTEQDVIRVDLRSDDELTRAYQEIVSHMETPTKSVLVQEMVRGKRELMAGLTRDVQFGPCVMFGLGGIFTEILKDVSFRLAPIETVDAMDMMNEMRGRKILEGVRGMEPVDLDQMARILVGVGRIGVEVPQIKEIDINPLVIRRGSPVAVDALVILM